MDIYKKFDYSRLSNMDIVSKILPLLQQGKFYLRDDGKIDADHRMHFDPPWVYTKRAGNRECHLWHAVFFGILGMLPIKCLQCWKIVVRPQTLEQLFQFYELQRKMDVPGKCGIETRKTVHGLYGGYFYTDSLQQGFDRLKQVRTLVTTEISPDIPIILKRGCTEFEMAFGPSNEWESKLLPDQEQIESTLNDLFVRPMFLHTQPEHLKARVMQEWIHFAYQNGDPTYIKFNGGEPMFPAYVTYEPEGGAV